MEKKQRILISLRDKMFYMEIRLNHIAPEQGSSSQLTVLPIKRLGLNLLKSDFWDVVRLRYGLPLKRLSGQCGCQKPYNVQHPISCKKGRFITLRHNQLRDNIAEMLEEVSSDVKVDLALSREEIKGSLSNKARSDISARTFWIRGQRASIDITAFDPNAQRDRSKTVRRCYEINEQEKKRTLSKEHLHQSCFQQLEEREENVL